MSDTTDTQALMASTISFWSGILPPNEAARQMAGQLLATRDGLALLRGKAGFEEEPASFLAALQASKEGAE